MTTDRVPSAALIQTMATELRGATLSEQRAQEVAADLRRLLPHAAAAAAGNDFNAEPGHFMVMLQRLAHPGQ